MLKKSTARNLMVFLTDATDHVSGLAGATLTLSLSKDGGAFATITPTVTERGNGWYNIALTTAHTDTLGDFVLRITASGADPIDLRTIVLSSIPGELPTELIEDTLTLKDIMRILLAVNAGDATGLEGATMTFKSRDGVTTRIQASYSSGARTITTFTP
jgi:hypothetical protein